MNLQREQGAKYGRYFKQLRIKSSMLSTSVKILGICVTCFLLEACYGAPRSTFKKLPSTDKKNAELAPQNSAVKQAATVESKTHEAGVSTR
ncbi:MAG: hypothetical protein WCM76_05730 [Bacteroidota bacterium]